MSNAAPSRSLIYNHPSWLTELRENLYQSRLDSPEKLMALANHLAKLNVEHGTGGPFGCIIAEQGSGQVAGLGVNGVISGSSIFHAEIIALWEAQQNLGRYDLGSSSSTGYTLAVSSSPCAMCIGAIIWSGVREVYCGAYTSDVEQLLGFEEGPIHPNLEYELAKRGIEYTSGILRDECLQVLKNYKAKGGVIYNGGKGFR